MKTITIPKRFGYPTLDIYINGKAYTFKSGEEITVEDNVADIIENAMALAPKIGRNKSKIAQLAEGSLQEITAEDLAGISKIAGCAYYSNLGLVKVTIPDGILTIEKNAFNWATNIKSVYLPKVPPNLENINAFSNLQCTFYCKSQESLDAYNAATNWSTLTGTHTFKVEP